MSMRISQTTMKTIKQGKQDRHQHGGIRGMWMLLQKEGDIHFLKLL